MFRRGDRKGGWCCGGGEVVEVEKWAKLIFITIIEAMLSLGGWGGGWCCGSGEVVEVGNLGEDV